MAFKRTTFIGTECYRLPIFLLRVIMFDVLNDVAPGTSLPTWSIVQYSTVNVTLPWSHIRNTLFSSETYKWAQQAIGFAQCKPL
jgi:hypothetical protein